MPTCRDVSEIATDYMEHTLSPPRWLSVRLHLLACEMCRRYLRQLRSTRALLGQGTLPPPSADMEDRIVAAASRPPSDEPA